MRRIPLFPRCIFSFILQFRVSCLYIGTRPGQWGRVNNYTKYFQPHSLLFFSPNWVTIKKDQPKFPNGNWLFLKIPKITKRTKTILRNWPKSMDPGREAARTIFKERKTNNISRLSDPLAVTDEKNNPQLGYPRPKTMPTGIFQCNKNNICIRTIEHFNSGCHLSYQPPHPFL